MDPVTLSILAGAGGGVMSKLFNGNKNPARNARPYLDQMPGVGHQYYDPYVNRGEQANQQANGMYGQFAEDPFANYNNIVQNYKPSEGYQFKRDEAMNAMEAAANSGGYAGGTYDQKERGKLANRLMGEDMQQYINNILGIQEAGLQGLQHQGDQGYGASGGAADYFGNALGERASMESEGQRWKNSNRSNLLQSALQGAGQGLQLGGALGQNATGGGQQFARMTGQQYRPQNMNINWNGGNY